jgi:peptidoglycan/xylan/chitin deacetylase (PgdA/CDA1 family)
MNKLFHKTIALIISVAVLINICPIFATATPSIDADIYRKKENEQMKIALTFDDGPHPRYTPQILDILDEFGIKATFFIIGINAENYPDTVMEVIKRGHEIGNHTYTHPHVSGIDSDKLKNEIERCESMVYGLTDYKTKLFRPPEGMIDTDVKSVIHTLDYKVLLWDIDTRDWAHTPAEEIAENVIKNINAGDIILMHDYVSYNSPTPEAVRIFVPKLLEMGYKFVVASELIGLD